MLPSYISFLSLSLSFFWDRKIQGVTRKQTLALYVQTDKLPEYNLDLPTLQYFICDTLCWWGRKKSRWAGEIRIASSLSSLFFGKWSFFLPASSVLQDSPPLLSGGVGLSQKETPGGAQPASVACKMEAQSRNMHVRIAYTFLHVWRRFVMLSRGLLSNNISVIPAKSEFYQECVVGWEEGKKKLRHMCVCVWMHD